MIRADQQQHDARAPMRPAPERFARSHQRGHPRIRELERETRNRQHNETHRQHGVLPALRPGHALDWPARGAQVGGHLPDEEQEVVNKHRADHAHDQ